MSITVRRATLEDVETIRTIGASGYQTHESFAGADYVRVGIAQRWSIEAVRRSIESSTTYLALVDEVPVGTAAVSSGFGTLRDVLQREIPRNVPHRGRAARACTRR